MKRFFLSGTGTDVGKTYVGVRLLRAFQKFGTTRGIKPYETGVDDVAFDETALQSASSLGKCHVGYFRCADPLAPAAIDGPLPAIEELADKIRGDSLADFVLVEGAGGLLVPVGHGKTIADLALALGDPLILVTYDGLGTLSHTLSAWESARARGLNIAAVILNRGACEPDLSQATNARLLSEFGVGPIFTLERDEGDDAFEAIARALKDRSHVRSK